MLNSYFGVFTHWILREFDISLYLTECYDNFINFKWGIPVKWEIPAKIISWQTLLLKQVK